MKKLLIVLLHSFLVATIVSCGGNDTKKQTGAAEEQKEEHENSQTATLTEAQIKSIGIELGVVEDKELTASLQTNGVLQVPNQNKATVNSLYSGVIKSLTVQPGNPVRKGQVIATVANPQFVQVQSDYLNVNARITLAELEVKRQKELNAGNAGALKNLQAAETELRTLRTARATYEQQVRLMGINPKNISNGRMASVLSITSPINGVISKVNIEMGAYIDVTTTVAEIVDNSQLHLDLFVYEKDLPKLKNNQLIHFTLTNNPGKEYDAQIYSLGSSFEGDSKAVTVHAKVQGDKTGLIDGMNVTAIISMEKATVPAVPAEAIVAMGGQDYIFVVSNASVEPERETEKPGSKKAGEQAQEHKEHAAAGEHSAAAITFEKIPVAKGTTAVGYTQVTLLKAIPKDAKIVVKGAFFVSAKMNNSGEHEH